MNLRLQVWVFAVQEVIQALPKKPLLLICLRIKAAWKIFKKKFCTEDISKLTYTSANSVFILTSLASLNMIVRAFYFMLFCFLMVKVIYEFNAKATCSLEFLRFRFNVLLPVVLQCCIWHYIGRPGITVVADRRHHDDVTGTTLHDCEDARPHSQRSRHWSTGQPRWRLGTPGKRSMVERQAVRYCQGCFFVFGFNLLNDILQ